MSMLTPALSELQAPSKFPELRMECKQSHFKNFKMSQWGNPVAIGSLLRSTAACAERMRASGDRVFTHRQYQLARANERSW